MDRILASVFDKYSGRVADAQSSIPESTRQLAMSWSNCSQSSLSHDESSFEGVF
ncbi:hypothetical protein D3800_18185 [Microcystis aeruginosa NIES-298]|uniref:Uncharacterized protein n=1 Tax=Microcystis viridis FACHB-1342 TaxID=2692900 RepID=A0ABR8GEW5_MICVR|nr:MULTISPECIES: hypothetical protein [Microcystis]NCS00390.1 hypothetical protein [Microcystis aeruginosa L311-01]MBD2601675.1 hypothetical protein [Microcystis viridis FACHB-1342]MDB9429142.1 hypothetical protein [Microcystis aeruginosa CS-555/01A07]QHU85075.1 hypothetical protein D3800_18185 [Microcystis aeruginosa NIES-298]WOB67596.1 hypothetical protein PJW00_18875 [Microcystis aeruginosa LE3]